MDKTTVKSIILKLREEGNTFQEIANILETEYEVKMSRQAVHGMYNRAVANHMDPSDDISVNLAINDIINYDIIGLKANEIKPILKSRYNISLSTVTIMETPLYNDNYRKTIYKERLDKLRMLIKSNDSISDIKSLLGYKGEEIRDSALNKLLYDYILLEVKDSAIPILTKTYNLTNDRTLIKDVAKKINLDITTKDLERVTT